LDSKERFTDYVEDYVRYRPSYPAALLDQLLLVCGLAAGSVAADIGAGTGKFTRLLLERGLTVYAVEPNNAMRAAAREALSSFGGFRSVAAPAERTTLPDTSADVVTAAQAFHWFDRNAFRDECRRILRPGGRVALVWNRRDGSAPVMRDYEEIIQAHHDDRPNRTMRDMGPDSYGPFFAGGYETHTVLSDQWMDCEGLVGRALSSSYAPRPGHPQHEPLQAALRALFDRYQEDGKIRFQYRSELIAGEV
jgi:SAM-dependent methyltransferase